LSTKVYVANLGGFDTHANQVEAGDTTTGIHAQLMDYLSSSVAAFQEDLKQIGKEEQVVTLTFSEFGRRIRSNDSNGTDHGSAAPMMLFGSCINPGVIGNSSSLPDIPSQSDGVPFQFDFRDVYGSILLDWFEVEETEVRSILYDDFTPLPLISGCQTTATSDILESVISHASPNPFDSWTTIQVESPGGHTRVSIYNALGHEVDVITNQKLSPGRHELKYDGSSLPSGNYFYRIQSAGTFSTHSIVKI